MSRQVMEKAISEAPNNALTRSIPHLHEVGDQLQDHILGILPTVEYADLVVTPSRIISVGRTGSIEVLRYADVKQILFSEGRKNLLGGRGSSILHIYLLNGSTASFQLPTGVKYEYLHRVGTLAGSACKKAQIANL